MKKINVIFVALMVISMICVGCAGESSVERNKFVGTWFSEETSSLWIFDDEGNIRALSPKSYIVSTDNFKYSVNKNENHIEMLLDGEERMYVFSFHFSDNDRLILTIPEHEDEMEVVLTRVKESDGKGNPIVGTWTAVDRDSFDFHINNSSYGAKSLSFYNDGTFRVVTNGGGGFGEYTFLFDGEVLQMQDHQSRGEFDYELFGERFMLIEFSIYNGEMQFGYLLTKE